MIEAATKLQIVELEPADVTRFLAFRKEAFSEAPCTFRFAAKDDAELDVGQWRDRLLRGYVVAVIKNDEWLGMGGFSRFSGTKLSHKGLIWGMYVIPAARGTGVADRVLKALLTQAGSCVRQVQLTVMADNARARAFYIRHRFELYGIEPASVRRGESYADEALMWRLTAD
jgi:ribosomal protein S18 acetylase RimI-like enzyme